MKILSLNCRNWNRDCDKSSPWFWKTRMAAMERMIKAKDPDVICFQEMIAPAGQYVPDGWKRVGVSVSHHIYIRKGVKAKNHKFGIHCEQADIDGVRVFCVHGDWEDKAVDKLCKHLKENAQVFGPTVAIGDFNVGATALDQHNLPKTARIRLGMPEEDTFENFTRPQESHGEIDHAVLWGCTPKDFEIIRYGYGAVRISDHWPIMVTI